jgi:hypothetical protein
MCLAGASFVVSAQAPGKLRIVGTVTSVEANALRLETDSGETITAQASGTTRIIRAVPGQMDLPSAPTIPLETVHAGDRMLVSGISNDGGKSIDAITLVVMSGSDLAQQRSQEQKAWQSGKRGVVTAIDAGARKVTLKSPAGSAEIEVAPSASVMRYRDGSSNFAEAQPVSIDQIKVGDQLQAKGQTHEKPDTAGFVADAVVFGTFVNVAGRITSVDPGTSAVTVNDVFTKKPVTLHLTAQSQMRQLPQMIAQRIAMAQRRSGGSDAGRSEQSPAPSRLFDFQQVIARSPSITIAELHKGDAIIAVAGSEAANSPAFYVVNGVEPILTASPGGSAAAALLASWNLSGNSGEGE